jgi:hypothetical protein
MGWRKASNEAFHANPPHVAKEFQASGPSTQDLGVVNAFPKLSPSPRRGAYQIVSERLIDGIRLDSASSDYFYLFYQCKAVQGWYADGLMFADSDCAGCWEQERRDILHETNW